MDVAGPPNEIDFDGVNLLNASKMVNKTFMKTHWSSNVYFADDINFLGRSQHCADDRTIFHFTVSI